VNKLCTLKKNFKPKIRQQLIMIISKPLQFLLVAFMACVPALVTQTLDSSCYNETVVGA
jgi:hypothetical protein